MAELKTQKNKASVSDYLKAVPDEQKRKDALELLKIFTEVTGEKAAMWGTAIVGFGMYHYKSERSSQEGDWPLAGFSPRKQALTLYVSRGFPEAQDLLNKLGKHTVSGGSCIYIKRLSDVDIVVLKRIIQLGYTAAIKMHGQVK